MAAGLCLVGLDFFHLGGVFFVQAAVFVGQVPGDALEQHHAVLGLLEQKAVKGGALFLGINGGKVLAAPQKGLGKQQKLVDGLLELGPLGAVCAGPPAYLVGSGVRLGKQVHRVLLVGPLHDPAQRLRLLGKGQRLHAAVRQAAHPQPLLGGLGADKVGQLYKGEGKIVGRPPQVLLVVFGKNKAEDGPHDHNAVGKPDNNFSHNLVSPFFRPAKPRRNAGWRPGPKGRPGMGDAQVLLYRNTKKSANFAGFMGKKWKAGPKYTCPADSDVV